MKEIPRSSEKPLISVFNFGDAPETYLLTKANFLVDLEDYREENNNLEIGRMEWMLIQTAFYMTHKIKEKHGSYLFNAETEFVISFDDFCKLWQLTDIKKKKADGSIYREISKALERVMDIQFTYPRIDNGDIAKSGYFSEISYSNQVFSFYIPNGIIGYIKNYGSYTWYFFENIIKLKENAGASMLFELINKSKHLKEVSDVDGKCTFEIEVSLDKLKKLLAPDSKIETRDFNRRALMPAINFISTNTTMNLEILSTIRKGRSIDKYVIGVTMDEKELDVRNAFKIEKNRKPLMNEEQRIKFAFALVSDPVFAAHEPIKSNEKVPIYINRIKNLLKDNEYVETHYEAFLKPCGYQNKHLDIKIKAKKEAESVVATIDDSEN
jgi:hypothetical protein